MDELSKNLERVNWQYKEQEYKSFLSSIEYKNVVKSPTVSIVIISWRFVKEMHENILSLQKQRHAGYELVFVNNGKDDTEFASIIPYVDTYVKLNQNTGAYKARNIGATFAKAPILLFLEDDGIPEKNFVKAHLEAFDLYEIISLRGVYKPLNKENEFNKIAEHYSLGMLPFPRFVDLEGNASYNAGAFYSVGGWDDDINFGHGGLELALRLFKKYPDRSLQIYSPRPVIYHDFAKSREHLALKGKRQKESLLRLKGIYPDWQAFVESWSCHSQKTYLIKKKRRTINTLIADAFSYVFVEILKPIYRGIFKRKRM